MAGPTIGLVSVWPVRSKSLPAPRASFLAGVATIWLGMALRQSAHVTLGRFHRGDVTIHAEHELVSEGPYAYIRHPLYAASIAVFTGIGLALGTPTSLAAAATLPTAALIYRIKIEEEALIASSLGTAYASYAEGKPRLLPGIW